MPKFKLYFIGWEKNHGIEFLESGPYVSKKQAFTALANMEGNKARLSVCSVEFPLKVVKEDSK